MKDGHRGFEREIFELMKQERLKIIYLLKKNPNDLIIIRSISGIQKLVQKNCMIFTFYMINTNNIIDTLLVLLVKNDYNE